MAPQKMWERHNSVEGWCRPWEVTEGSSGVWNGLGLPSGLEESPRGPRPEPRPSCLPPQGTGLGSRPPAQGRRGDTGSKTPHLRPLGS